MPIPAPPTHDPGPGTNSGMHAPGLVLDHVLVNIDGEQLGVVDENGVRIRVTKIDGWWDTPPSTGSVEQRHSDHGGWLTPAHYAPRIIQMTVRLMALDWVYVTEAINRIQAAVPLNFLKPLIIDDHGTPLTVFIRQEGDPLVDRQDEWADMSLSLVAPDPRKYSIDEVAASTSLPFITGGLQLPVRVPFRIVANLQSGLLTVSNDGNMPTRPVLTVHGPCPPFTLTHRPSGRQLQHHESVPAGRFLVIDTDKRTALLDGTAARFMTGSWFEYSPGENEVVFAGTSYDPGALLTSVHRHAFK